MKYIHFVFYVSAIFLAFLHHQDHQRLNAFAAQTRLDMPTQVRDANGQTIIDLSQARNYVSLQRFVCNASGGLSPNQFWNCSGVEYYKFTLKDGSVRDFAVAAVTPEVRADVATGPPKWTTQPLK